MKQLYPLILMCLMLFVSGIIFSQPVITYQNHAPFIGYSFTQKTFDSFFDPVDIDPGPAGPGQSWDYSKYQATEEYQATYINPASTPFADDIAGTDINIAIQTEEEDAEGYSFLHLNTSELIMRAFGILDEGEPLLLAMFDPSPVVFEFPFAYGDSFETQGEMQFTTEGITTINKMYATIEADAWGSLVTPLATYPNVLRIKTISIDSTFIYMDDMPIYSDGFVSHDYHWFSPDHRTMVFEISGDYEDEEFLALSYSYLFNETVNLEEVKTISFEVYPNPTADNINISYPFVGEMISFKLFDMNGRKLADIPEIIRQGPVKMDLTGMPKGVYVLQMLQNDQLIDSQKLVVQ